MDEKRKVARVKANAVVSFRIKSIRLAGGARVHDISELGICILAKQYIPVDSIVDLEIRSDDLKEPIKTSARVTRIVHRDKGVYPFEVGLVYLDILLAKQGMIHDYIQLAIDRRDNQEITWLD